jgi:hypothetical protein
MEVARCVESFEFKGERHEEGTAFDPRQLSVTERDVLILEGKIEIEDVSDAFEERAAIKEFDGGMSREDAEKATGVAVAAKPKRGRR